MTPELLSCLTPDQRAAWERCEKATSGPWQYDEMCPLSDGLYTWGEVNTADDTHTVAELDDAPICRVAPGLNVKHCPQYVDDGEFIAHARLDLPDALLQLAQLRAAVAEAPCPWYCASMVLYCPSCGTAHPDDREEWCRLDNRYGRAVPAYTKPCDCWKSRLPK